MPEAFPFSAIVGQEEMKLAILIAAIDPTIGGVLVFGDRGSGKSTCVRALAALLPKMPVVPAAATAAIPLARPHCAMIAGIAKRAVRCRKARLP